METISYQPIGYITSPFKEPVEVPKFYTKSGDATAQLDILPEYTDALLGVEPGMELMVIFHFHRIVTSLLQVPRAGVGPIVGVFAGRSPSRPNHLGVSIIKVQKVEGNRITFTGVDMLDGTPVLDLKLHVVPEPESAP